MRSATTARRRARSREGVGSCQTECLAGKEAREGGGGGGNCGSPRPRETAAHVTSGPRDRRVVVNTAGAERGCPWGSGHPLRRSRGYSAVRSRSVQDTTCPGSL